MGWVGGIAQTLLTPVCLVLVALVLGVVGGDVLFLRQSCIAWADLELVGWLR